MERADIKIYCLKHPNTLEIRYVGMTSKSLEKRLNKHIDNAKYTKHNKHLCNWILSILKLDKKPIIELLEEVDFNVWQEKEKFYISKFPRLLNFTLGGEGTFGLKHSEESKKKMGKKGVKPTKETLKKRSLALKGRIISEEHKLKIGQANKGKIYTKFKILVKDIINNSETIFNTVNEVHLALNVGEMTVRRNLNNNKIVKSKYIFMKI
jgi:group I intron endonuclease